jgi:hypothetical protein
MKPKRLPAVGVRRLARELRTRKPFILHVVTNQLAKTLEQIALAKGWSVIQEVVGQNQTATHEPTP